jgi:hypothetical protein
MATCSIIRNPQTNDIVRVLAPNGKDSNLFKSITDFVSDKEEAIKMWAYAYTDSFKEKFGDWEKIARINITDPGMDDITLENLALQFDQKLDNNGEPLLKEILEITKQTEDFSLDLFRSLINDNITFGQTKEIDSVVYDNNKVQYLVKGFNIISNNISKIKSWEQNNSISSEILFEKIIKLGVPRTQLILIMDQPGNTIEEKLASFAATYSYTVEINTAKDKREPDHPLAKESNQFFAEQSFFGWWNVVDKDDNIYRREIKTKEAAEKYAKELNEQGIPNTQYYSNLTVPGGTNYTENEIATPAITSSIKGHAQFATDNGIGWFRSDDKISEKKKEYSDKLKDAYYSDEMDIKGLEELEKQAEIPTKTRRILEVQSDLFQKGRDKQLLVPINEKVALDHMMGNTSQEMKDLLNSNQFLQLLNKDNNWVTFFVKSIIQDSAKKGYEKVLFPSGDTASKIEKHLTLEEFKKYNEDRIRQLEKDNEDVITKFDTDEILKKGLNTADLLAFKQDSEGNTYKVDILNSTVYKNGKEISNEEFLNILRKEKLKEAKNNSIITYERNLVEISTLKEELERVEREALGALKPIYKFYGIDVRNTLVKQYGEWVNTEVLKSKYGKDWKEKNLTFEELQNHLKSDILNFITDEYGNTWNEIKLKPTIASEFIMLQTENTASTKPSNEELNNKIRKFLEKIGVSVQSVDTIYDAAGNKLSATAKADMLNRIIQVIDGKAKIDTLPEEAAHFFVEMLGAGHPLYKEMYKKITNYKIYTTVVEKYKNLKKYRNDDGTIDFDKLKKEAIGKLIAEHIINQNFGNETDFRIAESLAWWQKIWKFITSLFSKEDSNPFETAAEKILDADITLLDVDKVLSDEFYQYNGDPVDNLLDDQNNITLDDSVDPRTGQKRHTYFYKSVPGKGSVTGVYVDKFLKRIFRSDERSEKQRVLDLVKADFGDIIHYEIKKIIDSWLSKDGTFNKYQTPIKSKLPLGMYTILNKYVQSLLSQYEPGTRFITEAKIFDQKLSIGGSIDLLVIKKDGEVDIYDWKSTEIAKEQSDLKEYKESVFKIQLDNYRKILATQYGFKNFGTIRAIPIATRFNYSKGDIKSLKSIEIGSLNPSDIPYEKSYLLPVLLRNEPTGNKQLDVLIERINGIYEKIKDKKVGISEINQKREELKNLRTVLRDLQLRKRVDKLIELGMIEFKKYSDKIENNSLTGRDILEGIKILDVFSDSGVMLYELMEEYAEIVDKSEDKKLKSEFNKINRQFLQMTNKVSGLIMQMKEYQKEQAIKLAEEKGITNYLDPESPVGTMSGLFQALSNIKQKAFRVFSTMLRRVQGKRDNNIKESFNKLSELKNSFAKWAKQKGLSTSSAMEMILEIDNNGKWNGNFLEKYDSVFKNLKKDAINKGDLKWLKDNLQFDPENKYNDSLKRQKEYFSSIIYASDKEVNDKIVEEKINEWIDQHNIIDKHGQLNMTALINPRNIFLKPTDNWLSNKWKELYKKDGAGNYVNKPLVDMFEYFQSLTKKAEELGMLDRYNPKFIPSIHAGKIENLVFGNVSNFLSVGKFFSELEVDSGNKYTPQIDPTDGSIVNTIPVYFTKDMGVEKQDASGNTYTDFSAKSRDLFKVFAIWANHVYNYEAMSSIEDDAINLLEVEKQKQSLVTDNFNNPIIENGKVKAANTNDRNSKLLEEFMNYYIYDRTSGVITDVKITNPFTKKEYSMLKTVNAAMRYFSLKTLGLNFISSTSQFVGGTGNALFTAQKGIFFTKNTWAKSMYYTSSSKKAMAALEYLNILQDAGTGTLVDKLSLTSTDKILSSDNAFILQRLADKTVQYPIAIALMLEHMVDPTTGSIVSIQNYVKSKYDYNNKYYNLSESERNIMKNNIDKEVGELQDTKSLFAIGKINEKGLFEIDGVDNNSDTFLEFRDKIKGVNKRIIGNQTRDDINGIRTTLLGSSLMQFRNWIPEMVEERISGLKYDDELQTWVYGKFNIFFGDLFSNRFPKLLKAIMTGFGHDAIELAKMRYEELKIKAYERGEEFNITEGEFIDIYIGNLKSIMAELLVLLAVGAAVTAITSTGDDDRKNNGFKKYMSRALKKYYNEFAFYFLPIEFARLLKNPVPVIGLTEDFYKFGQSVIKESYGTITGDSELTDKAMPMKQFLKSVPVGKEYLLLHAAADKDFRKEWNIRVDNYFYQ